MKVKASRLMGTYTMKMDKERVPNTVLVLLNSSDKTK